MFAPIPGLPGAGSGTSLKTILLITLAVGALFLGVYLYGRKAGKGEGPPPAEELPDSGSGIPKGWTPGPMVAKVRDGLSGYLLNTNNAQSMLGQLTNLTDDQLTAVYNEYNRQFMEDKDDDTMYGAIKSKILLSKDFWDWFDRGNRPEVLSRMEKLKLYKDGEV